MVIPMFSRASPSTWRVRPYGDFVLNSWSWVNLSVKSLYHGAVAFRSNVPGHREQFYSPFYFLDPKVNLQINAALRRCGVSIQRWIINPIRLRYIPYPFPDPEVYWKINAALRAHSFSIQSQMLVLTTRCRVRVMHPFLDPDSLSVPIRCTGLSSVFDPLPGVAVHVLRLQTTTSIQRCVDRVDLSRRGSYSTWISIPDLTWGYSWCWLEIIPRYEIGIGPLRAPPTSKPAP